MSADGGIAQIKWDKIMMRMPPLEAARIPPEFMERGSFQSGEQVRTVDVIKSSPVFFIKEAVILLGNSLGGDFSYALQNR